MARICNILIVEDNASIREFLQELLDDEGYRIAVVATGEEMRQALAERSFDIALIDVTLPGADDGFALAELVQKRGCAVILVTGDARHYDRVQASGHRYLLKPFRIERLLLLISEVLQTADCRVGK
jgi:DNA-binding response OmpR family regulator